MEIIHIGFSKSASTYLQSIFIQNEDLNYTYKSKRFSLLPEKQKKVVLRENEINLESDEHIILPSFHPELKVRATCLDDVDTVLDKIFTHNPDCKLLLVIRNHSDLLKSRYSQYILGGGTLNIDSFVTKLNGFRKGEKDYFQNYYFQIVSKLEEKFDKENILVVLNEELKEHGHDIIKEISTFAGTEFYHKKPSVFSMRKGLTKNALELIKNVNKKFVASKQDYTGEVTFKIPENLYIGLIRIIRFFDYFRRRSKCSISTSLVRKVEEKFAEDNKKLADFFHKDLKKLGYYY